MRPVKVQDIVLGQTVGADVTNIHGQAILANGSVVGRHQLTLLKAWGIVEVQIDDDGGPEPKERAAIVPPGEERAGNHHKDESLHPVLAELEAVVARLGRASEFVNETGATADAVEAEALKKKPVPWAPAGPETVAERARTLVSLPTIYLQVEKAINHPSSSSGDIAKVLRSDQGVCARLLRIANSAFYGFPRRVEGVDEAIRIIGTRQLHDLVLATVVLMQFRGVDASLVSMKSFWQHSFACGIAARAMASLRRESNTERFFVGGLLHDIGSLVLYQELPRQAAAALEEHHRSKLPLDEVERSVIGCDHGQVGAALMGHWKLPEFYRGVAAHHHNPKHHAQGSQGVTVGTAVVHLADLLVSALGLGSNGEAVRPVFCPEAWDAVGLPLGSLERTSDEVIALVDEALRLFVEE